jgi:hypothetical protein
MVLLLLTGGEEMTHRKKSLARNLETPILPDFPAELQLMLNCLRGFFAMPERREPELVSLRGVNWKTFVSMACHHKVIPFLHAESAFLKANGCPEDVLQELSNGSVRNALNNGAMAGELLQLSDLFEQNDIPMIAIKGIPQAILLYSGIQFRSPCDIDVLISPETMVTAHQALCRAGYEHQSRYSKFTFVQSIARRIAKDSTYKHRDNTGEHVELHSRLYFFRSVFSLSFDSIRAESRTLNIGPREVRTLSDELTVIFLLSHGALHAWHKLFWLCDVAQVFHSLSSLNWANIMTIASRFGVARNITSGLVLANILLGSPLPDEFRKFAQRDSVVYQLVKYFVRQMAACDGRDSLSSRFNEVFYWCKLGASLRYKAEVVLTSPLTSGLIATCWDSVMNLRRLGDCRLSSAHSNVHGNVSP